MTALTAPASVAGSKQNNSSGHLPATFDQAIASRDYTKARTIYREHFIWLDTDTQRSVTGFDVATLLQKTLEDTRDPDRYEKGDQIVSIVESRGNTHESNMLCKAGCLLKLKLFDDADKYLKAHPKLKEIAAEKQAFHAARNQPVIAKLCGAVAKFDGAAFQEAQSAQGLSVYRRLFQSNPNGPETPAQIRFIGAIYNLLPRDRHEALMKELGRALQDETTWKHTALGIELLVELGDHITTSDIVSACWGNKPPDFFHQILRNVLWDPKEFELYPRGARFCHILEDEGMITDQGRIFQAACLIGCGSYPRAKAILDQKPALLEMVNKMKGDEADPLAALMAQVILEYQATQPARLEDLSQRV